MVSVESFRSGPMNPDFIRSTFMAGLRNIHAVEKEALAILKRQVERLENYPELSARIELHIDETNMQIERLDRIFASLDESASGLKDAAMNLMGNLAALGHSIAPDEVIKNSLASFAFENFEAASYKSLITIAEAGELTSAVPALQQSLDEELAMAAFLDENLPMVTRRFLDLGSAGEQAKR